MTPLGRVLLLGKAYPPWVGGVEKHMEDLARHLHRRGWEVDVLCAAANGTHSRETRDGVNVHRLAARGRLWSQPLALGYVTACRRLARNADIVHLHVPNPLGELASVLASGKKPLVVTWHSDVVRQRIAAPVLVPLERACLRRAECVLATSPPYARNSPRLSEFAGKVRIVPLGLDLERFDSLLASSEPAMESAAERYEQPITLCVARLVSYKGLGFLIRAMPGLPGSVIVVGDGPLRNDLLALADNLGVGNRLHIEAGLSDAELACRYRIADVFVLPSVQRSEAFGIVQLEAFAAGLPVISTALPTGVPWVNQDGVTGLVVEPANTNALAAASRRLLRDNPMRQSMGRAARNRVETSFNLSCMVSQVEAVYTSVLRV